MLQEEIYCIKAKKIPWPNRQEYHAARGNCHYKDIEIFSIGSCQYRNLPLD